ncbi:hypothetical protein MMC26_000291 [Xylographa opegraphella]|nr:hypothetical protein [Xylographa opegraphella]
MDYPALWNSQLGISVIVISVVFESLAVIAVVLRIWSRRIQGTALVLNDFAILAALLFTTGLVGIIILSVAWAGEGQAFENVPPQDQGRIFMTFVIETPVWGAANTLVKISILHLYVTIFPSPTFRKICYTMMAVSTLYFISILLETFLLCMPFVYNWNKMIEGTCGNQTLALLMIGAANLIIDAIIVVLPLPLLWRLQLPIWKKVGLVIMFSLGAFTCVVTLLRIIRIQNTNLADTDPTISGAIIAQWSILEPTIAIVNSCFPTIRPVLNKYFPSLAWAKRLTTKNSSGNRSRPSMRSPLSSKASPSSTIGDKKQFQRLDDDRYPLQEVYVSSKKPLPSTPNYYAVGVDGPVVPPEATRGASGITYTREWKVHAAAEECWV